MRPAALCLLLAALPAGAAPVRTFSELAALAADRGKEHALTETGAEELGLPRAATRLRSLEAGRSARGGWKRAFSVAYGGASAAATAVIFWRMDEPLPARFKLKARHRSYVADLEGRLVYASDKMVRWDKTSYTVVRPETDAQAGRDFDREKDFWLQLGFDFK